MARKLEKQTLSYVFQGIVLIVIAVVTLEASSIIQYLSTQKVIREEVTLRAQGQLDATNFQITTVLDEVETAVRNNAWVARKLIDRPDSLLSLTGHLVENNAFISGSAIAFADNYYPDRGRLFAPFTYRSNGEVFHLQLGNEAYNYPEQEWFQVSYESGEDHWSEPYFDAGGGEMQLTTYSLPIRDDAGRIAAILTADISLDWLTEQLGNVKVYPGAFSMLVSKSGAIMMCPADTLVMRKTVQEAAASLDDATAVEVARAMLSGKSGSMPVQFKGHPEYVFYAPVSDTGWSMCIVIPSHGLFGRIRRVQGLVNLLQVIGILLLALILWFSARNQLKIREMAEKKNRMESELHIARDIQMSLLPKIVPPYPDRQDIDMYAAIFPAKEVGGDLYDFHFEQDKLYFCIGDVSGKGIPASLVMASAKSMFRTVSAQEKSPERIVAKMNDSMADMNESNMFVTFFAGILNLKDGRLLYCNAGHNAPVHVGAGSVGFLPVEANLPLGVLPGYEFKEQQMTLSPGDSLFLYTDGLTEAEDAQYRLFGEERLLACLGKHVGAEASTLLDAVTEAVKKHVGKAPQSDDLTMFALHFTQSAPATGTERHLVLHNDIGQIAQLGGFIEAIAEETEMDPGTAMNLNLALEEAVTNVIMYAYPEGADGLVDLKAIIHDDQFEFILSDNGKSFDPTKAENPDLSISLADRPIGGLGIYLVNTIMDSVSYVREDGKNVLSMIKKRQ